VSHPTFSRTGTLAPLVETIAVYPVHAAPDAPLARLRERLEAAGFSVDDAEELDLAARRGVDRLFVGLGAHEDGLAARWKTKSLVPGRARSTHQIAEQVLTEVLGSPERRFTPGEGSP